ncbi:MAG: O-antigen ligase family protein [Halofilum sp. (in: g-proteobacteria)]|nr:O-antigen ligase family protein [Halofilum sp. (in: g-proteobacteria)]
MGDGSPVVAGESGVRQAERTEAESVAWSLRCERWFLRVAAGPAIVLMALAAVYDRGLANLGLAVLLLGFFVFLPLHWRSVIRDPIAWVALIFFVWTPFWGSSLAESYPEYADLVRSQTQTWLKVLFLPMLVTGFWLVRLPRLLPWIPLLIATGYLVRVIVFAEWGMLERIFSQGERAEFGIVATHFGLYSLLSLIAAATAWRTIKTIPSVPARYVLKIFISMVSLVSLLGVVLAQTRSVWLASILIAVALAILVARGLRDKNSRLRTNWLAVFASSVLVGMAAYGLSDIVGARLVQHRETIVGVLSLDFEGLAYNPIGYRIRAYATGLATWLEAPFLGHGPGIDQIRMNTIDDLKMRYVAHFHNEYINLLATYGLFGFILFGAGIAAAGRRSRGLIAGGQGYTGVLIFVMGASFAIAVFSLFGQSFMSHEMPFVIALLGGLAMAGENIKADRQCPHAA